MGVAKKVFNEEVAFAPATEHIGSEVSGIDLANPLPDSVFQQIQRELHDRSVLIFHDQNWSPNEHIEFSLMI